MSTNKRTAKALLQLLDAIAERHGPTNPDLLPELSKHRAELEAVLRQSSRFDIAQTCFRVATWVKFIFDFF